MLVQSRMHFVVGLHANADKECSAIGFICCLTALYSCDAALCAVLCHAVLVLFACTRCDMPTAGHMQQQWAVLR